MLSELLAGFVETATVDQESDVVLQGVEVQSRVHLAIEHRHGLGRGAQGDVRQSPVAEKVGGMRQCPPGIVAVASAQVHAPQPGEHLEGGAKAAAAAEDRSLQAEQPRLEELVAGSAGKVPERPGGGLLCVARL